MFEGDGEEEEENLSVSLLAAAFPFWLCLQMFGKCLEDRWNSISVNIRPIFQAFSPNKRDQSGHCRF